jgi:hypothetical protein
MCRREEESAVECDSRRKRNQVTAPDMSGRLPSVEGSEASRRASGSIEV